MVVLWCKYSKIDIPLRISAPFLNTIFIWEDDIDT